MTQIDIALKNFEIRDEDYGVDDVKIFISCIMSENIGPDYISRCLIALGTFFAISKKEYTETGETDEDGDVDEWVTSDFEKFVENSLYALCFDGSANMWLKETRDYLVRLERYEILHELKLEDTWKI
tara:strand:- start:3916 stop:4296 length:381 start_codon:yes stop_codon:yes gene_type:complete